METKSLLALWETGGGDIQLFTIGILVGWLVSRPYHNKMRDVKLANLISKGWGLSKGNGGSEHSQSKQIGKVIACFQAMIYQALNHSKD